MDQKIIINKVERPIVQLPKKMAFVKPIELSESEHRLYKALFDVATAQIKGFQNTNSLTSNYTTVLELLVRMRMLCNSGDMVPQKVRDALAAPDPKQAYERAYWFAAGESKTERLLNLLRAAREDSCMVCFEPDGDVITLCSHTFHRSCLEIFKGTEQCPYCRAPADLPRLISQPAATKDAVPKNLPPSSKMLAVLDVLQALKRKSHKVVVFAQFNFFLQQLADSLDGRNVGYVSFTRSMSHHERKQATEDFRNDPNIKVLLCSLKASGVGIDMTPGDHVIICDPWWNVPFEEQAIDRCHRLGQAKSVTVIRLVAKDTVEQKLLEIQATKDRKRDDSKPEPGPKQGERAVRLELVSKLFGLTS